MQSPRQMVRGLCHDHCCDRKKQAGSGSRNIVAIHRELTAH